MIDRLSSSQKKVLLDFARKTISSRLDKNESLPEIPQGAVLNKRAATFVTLKISGRLRGCIGHLESVTSLWESVRDNALNAAFHDHRFPPLDSGELEEIEIDISILSTPIVLKYRDSTDLLKKLQQGVDGVILKDGHRGATFLPQVWKQLPSKELFLDQLCRKAGLEETVWRKRKVEIKIYHVQSFKGEDN